MEGDAYCLAGEVAPCVQLFFWQITFGDVAPEAFLGLHVEAFEREWQDRLARTGLAPEHENPPLGLHIANVEGLGTRPWSANSPSDQDVAAVLDWLDRVFEYAKRLPCSVDGLASAVEANRIADHNVEASLGHPVRVRGFLQWLRGAHGIDLSARVLPLLSDRTEPYDVRVMLNAD